MLVVAVGLGTPAPLLCFAVLRPCVAGPIALLTLMLQMLDEGPRHRRETLFGAVEEHEATREAQAGDPAKEQSLIGRRPIVSLDSSTGTPS